LPSRNAAVAADTSGGGVDQTRVAAGVMEDPRAMLKRMNALLERVLA